MTEEQAREGCGAVIALVGTFLLASMLVVEISRKEDADLRALDAVRQSERAATDAEACYVRLGEYQEWQRSEAFEHGL